jgi:hypothetical protein
VAAPGQIRYFTNAIDTMLILNTDFDSSFEALIRAARVHTPTSKGFKASRG